MNNLRRLVILGSVLVVSLITSGCNNKSLDIPGESKVDSYYAYNIMPMIETFIDYDVVKGCKDVKILDSKLKTQPSGMNTNWEEIWIVDACGKTLEVPLLFLKTGNYVRTIVDSTEIKEITK